MEVSPRTFDMWERSLTVASNARLATCQRSERDLFPHYMINLGAASMSQSILSQLGHIVRDGIIPVSEAVIKQERINGKRF